jgi:tetratricopeptide (TPR) repeat protein
MQKLVLICCLLIASCHVFAQQDVKQLYESAKILMRQGEYETATTILLKAVKQDSSNLDMQKDLAYLYLLQNNPVLSAQISRPLIDRADADAQCFQMLGMAYKAAANYSECATLYKYGILKFPHAGVLYNEYGELLAMQQQLDQAIVQWEKGIEQDPNHSNNYYNASMYYALNRKWLRVALYGEYFINLESYTAKTETIKGKLLNAFQALLQPGALQQFGNGNSFEKAFTAAICQNNNASKPVNISMDNLLQARLAFLTNWGAEKASQFPLRLFDHLLQLQKEGIWDAYQQWVFGAALNPTAYQQWQTVHAKEAQAFQQFQQGRVFKVPTQQYYTGN